MTYSYLLRRSSEIAAAEVALEEWVTFTVCCLEWVVIYCDWGRRKHRWVLWQWPLSFLISPVTALLFRAFLWFSILFLRSG